MNDSWIAVADRHGLKLLVLETQHAVQFALRRAEREIAECFWAVLQPHHAKYVSQQIELGNSDGALKLLEMLASDIGRITPCSPALPHWLPEYVTIPDNCDREWNN